MFESRHYTPTSASLLDMFSESMCELWYVFQLLHVLALGLQQASPRVTYFNTNAKFCSIYTAVSIGSVCDLDHVGVHWPT